MADVFDPERRYLGEVALPAPIPADVLPRITRDHLYTVVRDDMDVQHLVRYRIHRPLPSGGTAMRSTSRSIALVPVVPALLALAACGDGERDPAAHWTGTVDTLENGVVHVQNPVEGAWMDDTIWRLVEEVRIGRMDGEGPDVFGSVASLEVDRLGRVYVLDRQAKEIRVFDMDGSHVRTMGREGGGPGELSNPTGFGGWLDGEHLLVADPGNNRYAVWDTTGAERGTYERRLPGMRMPTALFVDTAGRPHDVTLGALPAFVLRMTPGFEVVDSFPRPESPVTGGTLLSNPEGRVRMGVPFQPGAHTIDDPRGYMWQGRSDIYRIVQLDLETGDTVRVIDREHEPDPVTRADIDEQIEQAGWFTQQGGRIRASDFPDRKSAFRRVDFVDEGGYLWISMHRPAGENDARWDVFDPEGRYLGEVGGEARIAGSPAPIVRGDRLYAVVTDELDVPYVVRFRLEGREG